MPRLTKRTVESVAPSTKPIFLWDDQLAGFGVKILPGGQRKYVVKYRIGGGGRSAAQRWQALGSHGPVTCDQARHSAQQVLAAVARGEDPQGARLAQRTAPTLQNLWERYEKEHLPRKKASSAKDDRQKWRDHIEPALGTRRIADISRSDIHRLHQVLSDRPYQANRLLALLSKLFNLAERWGMRPDGSNPCKHVDKYKEEARDRYLTTTELERLGDALRTGLAAQTESPYMVAAIQLLLLTGARVNEILGLRWEWVDLERRVVRLPDSKTGAKPLFLSGAAVEVLKQLRGLPKSDESPFVLRGRRADQPLVNLAKPWARICSRAGLVGVRLHDLRHTAASIAVGQGIGLPIVGRLLGHRNASTTNRYAHVDLDPALAAADRLGEVILEAFKPRA